MWEDRSLLTLVDQVLQQKDETLRTLYEENEELKAQMAEYEQ
eukprot:COSAG04_NODE_32944_length_190_cov_13.978022_1_plen_41_part_01